MHQMQFAARAGAQPGDITSVGWYFRLHEHDM